MLTLSMIKRLAFPIATLVFSVVLRVDAQNTFNSGSTGADGAFAPTTSQTIQIPESGVFNFTTVNIPAGVTITFLKNSKNTPITLLATGNVTIAGTINIEGKIGNANGAGGSGGPGGFNGGSGGFAFDGFSGTGGDGPGGGGGGGSTSGTNYGSGGGGGFATAGATATGQSAGAGGPRYGSRTLLPLIGGSGGGGGGSSSTVNGTGAGGGGGAILIASSSSIQFNSGTIIARGGAVGGNTNTGLGGGGSGGAIRLVANTVSGNSSLYVDAGAGGGLTGGKGSAGYIRVEAFDYASFSSTTSMPTSFALPNPVTVPNAPKLKIASVGGQTAPASPLGSLGGPPDVIVPTTQANPVSVVIEGTNVPVGTAVTVTLAPASGARSTYTSNALAGTDAASTASATVTLPQGMSVLSASATIDLVAANAKPLFMQGERVERIEVAATFGGPSELTYVTKSGRRIKE